MRRWEKAWTRAEAWRVVDRTRARLGVRTRELAERAGLTVFTVYKCRDRRRLAGVAKYTLLKLYEAMAAIAKEREEGEHGGHG